MMVFLLSCVHGLRTITRRSSSVISFMGGRVTSCAFASKLIYMQTTMASGHSRRNYILQHWNIEQVPVLREPHWV